MTNILRKSLSSSSSCVLSEKYEPFRIEIDLMTYDVEREKMTSRTRRYVRAILLANCSSSATNTSRRF